VADPPARERLRMPDRLSRIIQEWRAFTDSPLAGRLLPFYIALLGAAGGALVADLLVRSMWRHALFTGPYQWRTAALLLTVLWIAIGAVAATAALGPDADDGATGDG